LWSASALDRSTSDGAHLLGGKGDEADEHQEHEDLLHARDPNPFRAGCL
jgi:hypothetical protein